MSIVVYGKYFFCVTLLFDIEIRQKIIENISFVKIAIPILPSIRKFSSHPLYIKLAAISYII